MATSQAVILAAGVGSRLRPLTDDRPKALVPVGGRPVVARALDALGACGVTSVVVVLGHARQALAAFLAGRRGLTIRCVDNPAYSTTNTLASLACAAPAVDGDFLLLDGDLVFEPAVLGRLLGRGGRGARLAIDRDRLLDDDAVQVALDGGGRIAAVGKRLPPGSSPRAESIGLGYFDRATAGALLSLSRRMLAEGCGHAYYEAAFQRLLDRGVRLEAADVTGLRWVEIDDHDDLRRAEAAFVAA